MNKLLPWLVAACCLWLYGSVLWSYYTWLPVRAFDVYLMIWMGIAIAVVIRGYFRINTIFDRMDKR